MVALGGWSKGREEGCGRKKDGRRGGQSAWGLARRDKGRDIFPRGGRGHKGFEQEWGVILFVRMAILMAEGWGGLDC